MTEPSPSPDQGERLEEFDAELARLRVRASTPSTEHRLLLAGIALMPVGLLLVVAGWYGASGTTEFDEQVPYLLSGGVLGLGLVVVGAALFLRYSLARYLRFWLLRLIYEERASGDRHVEAVERLGELLVHPRDRETQP